MTMGVCGTTGSVAAILVVKVSNITHSEVAPLPGNCRSELSTRYIGLDI